MTRNLRRFFLPILLLVCLPGCTTRAWYDGMQHSARTTCQQQPSSEQARCEARLNKQDYDSYETSRSAIQSK